jgi:hypothetical protein
MLELGVGGLLQVLLLATFPIAVAVGLALDEVSSRRPDLCPRRLSEVVLLGGAPLAIVASLTTRADLTSREILGPMHVALVVVAAAAYLGACAQQSTSRSPRRLANAHPLPASARIVEPRWARAIRRGLVGAVGLGAIAFVALAPLATGHAARVSRFGADGAETAALLASALGTALGIVTLGAIVAPAMRARSAADRVPKRWGGSTSVIIAIVAFAAWLWLESSE